MRNDYGLSARVLGAALLLVAMVLLSALAVLTGATGEHSLASAAARELQPPVATATSTITPTPTATLAPGECRDVGNKVATEKVWLGDTAAITITFRRECVDPIYPLHIALVLDGSGAMAGSLTRDMKAAVLDFVKDLDLGGNPNTKVAVVEFNTQSRVLCQLTNDAGRVNSCIRRVGAEGGVAIDRGIAGGLQVLVRGRGGSGSSDIYEVMVLVSQGHNDAGCSPVLKAAGQVKGQGVLLITVCAGRDCDAQCMRQAASSPRYFFTLDTMGLLGPIFQQIRQRIRGITLNQVTVTDTLPANMRYVPDSADPAPKEIGPNGDYLIWQTNYVPRDGVTYSFEVEPQELGCHPTNGEARADYKDNQNRSGSYAFPVPIVAVEVRPSPTPTATATNTPTPTSTPTATQTPTATPGPEGIFLPDVRRWL